MNVERTHEQLGCNCCLCWLLSSVLWNCFQEPVGMFLCVIWKLRCTWLTEIRSVAIRMLTWAVLHLEQADLQSMVAWYMTVWHEMDTTQSASWPCCCSLFTAWKAMCQTMLWARRSYQSTRRREGGRRGYVCRSLNPCLTWEPGNSMWTCWVFSFTSVLLRQFGWSWLISFRLPLCSRSFHPEWQHGCWRRWA